MLFAEWQKNQVVREAPCPRAAVRISDRLYPRLVVVQADNTIHSAVVKTNKAQILMH